MSNPFDDLSVSDSSSSTDSTTDTEVAQESEAEPEPKPEPDPTPRQPTKTTVEDTSGPAFEFDEVRQRPLYARGETWDAFEDAVGITVVPELRKAGIRDEEKREIHDAVLRLAIEEPERVAKLIESERG